MILIVCSLNLCTIFNLAVISMCSYILSITPLINNTIATTLYLFPPMLNTYLPFPT